MCIYMLSNVWMFRLSKVVVRGRHRGWLHQAVGEGVPLFEGLVTGAAGVRLHYFGFLHNGLLHGVDNNSWLGPNSGVPVRLTALPLLHASLEAD